MPRSLGHPHYYVTLPHTTSQSRLVTLNLDPWKQSRSPYGAVLPCRVGGIQSANSFNCPAFVPWLKSLERFWHWKCVKRTHTHIYTYVRTYVHTRTGKHLQKPDYIVALRRPLHLAHSSPAHVSVVCVDSSGDVQLAARVIGPLQKSRVCKIY